MSKARSNMELANMALENALLAELEQTDNKTAVAEIQSARAYLSASAGDLAGMQQAIGQLRRQMREANYADLPTLKKLNLQVMGERLSEMGMVNPEKWRQATGTMLGEGGFYAILDRFGDEVKTIQELTSGLSKKFEFLEGQAERGQLNLVLEQNREGNIKIEFAQLYQRWCDFQSFFLASSMLSTELWYQHRGFGQLSEGPGSKPVAVAQTA